MSLSCGIVGLPNVGKSTLFNAITHANAPASSYPFCTIDANVGVVAVPDPRLELIAKIFHSKTVVPATVNFVDIAGLVRGASHGQGLGNQFLSRIREVDAIAMVVRCFESADVAHVEGDIDPRRDIDVVNIELALADMAAVDRRLEKTRPRAHADPKLFAEVEALQTLRTTLDAGAPARSLLRDAALSALAKELFLLSAKPMLLVANLDERTSAASRDCANAVCERAREMDAACFGVCARLEAELATLPPDEAKALAAEYGLKERALDEFIIAAYRLLHLMTFFTANENEAHAWTIERGATAVQAAAEVHTDMARGFIRAEVVSYDDLARLGSVHAARDAGLFRIEGRDYVMREGDVVFFRFNV
jgi:ribosome-binding ATPase